MVFDVSKFVRKSEKITPRTLGTGTAQCGSPIFYCDRAHRIFLAVLSLRMFLVNKQDFLQVFQGSGIGKIEDNLRSADPLSY